jgi:hypothetical protein
MWIWNGKFRWLLVARANVFALLASYLDGAKMPLLDIILLYICVDIMIMMLGYATVYDNNICMAFSFFFLQCLFYLGFFVAFIPRDSYSIQCAGLLVSESPPPLASSV